MKVISRPSGGEKWATEVTCNICGAVLEIEEADIIIFDVGRSQKLKEHLVPFIKCGNCYSSFDVEKLISRGMTLKLIEEFKSKQS